jgi:hypothetical protein
MSGTEELAATLAKEYVPATLTALPLLLLLPS